MLQQIHHFIHSPAKHHANRTTINIVDSVAEAIWNGRIPELSLAQYLRAIETATTLSESEEKQLCQLAGNNPTASTAARLELIKANLGLVAYIAQTFEQEDAETLKLIVVGNQALVQAARRIDFSGCPRFSAYAAGIIRAHMHSVMPAFEPLFPREP